MSTADDLFAGSGPPVGPPPSARLDRARRWLGLAFVLDILGPFCFTSVPGALLTLWAWQAADEELARVESGALPATLAGPARNVRRLAWGLASFCAMSMTFQVMLFWIGFYEAVLTWVVGLVG